MTASDIDDLYYENKRLKAEVEYLRGERAAVVAWLRSDDAHEFACDEHADFIERGAHRRKEGA